MSESIDDLAVTELAEQMDEVVQKSDSDEVVETIAEIVEPQSDSDIEEALLKVRFHPILTFLDITSNNIYIHLTHISLIRLFSMETCLRYVDWQILLMSIVWIKMDLPR